MKMSGFFTGGLHNGLHNLLVALFLACNNDRDSTAEENRTTFILINIVLQAPTHNRQSWRLLEEYCRWVRMISRWFFGSLEACLGVVDSTYYYFALYNGIFMYDCPCILYQSSFHGFQRSTNITSWFLCSHWPDLDSSEPDRSFLFSVVLTYS